MTFLLSRHLRMRWDLRNCCPWEGVGKWLSIPYGWAIQFRGYLYDRGWLSCHRLPRPVMSVGNVTVGGTGKTPVVIWLTQWLQSQGWRVGILSRGYGRSQPSRMVLVSDGQAVVATPREGGDEPVLIARRCPGSIVAVGSDRYRVGRWVLEQYEVDCFVLDDGYQHRALHRDLDLVLIDATDYRGLSGLLPMGRLREPLSGIERATAVALTRAGVKESVQGVVRLLEEATGRSMDPILVDFSVRNFAHVATGMQEPVQWIQGKRVLLVCGIGNPSAFRTAVQDLGADIRGVRIYPDHHEYHRSEVEEMLTLARSQQAELILTTEKDAVKLQPWLGSQHPVWAACLAVHIDEQGRKRLTAHCQAVMTAMARR
ncbi:MAG: tetraacyldisaccharide 4'-kinase [Nitrospirae bacterium]|nr:MAG: tetraacyldisaccharide 4'-kinase [Nitrospirota bacterium]